MAMAGFTFQSLPIIQHLARNTRQSPPPSTGSGFEYIDSSLRILAKSSVTKDEFEARHALQEKAIRGEFQQQRVYMDGRFEEVDGRFEEVDKKFVEQRTYMDGRFEQVNRRFELVDERFDRLEARFDQMEGRAHNSLVHSSWDQIYPVGSFNPLAPPGSRFRMPEYFPNRVVKFWRLKEHRNVKRLSELLEFFNTRGFQRWGAYDMDSSSDESDSDEPSSGYQTLEAAVRSQPEIALRALATHLGLNYDRVANSMRAAESEWQFTKQVRSKRTQYESGGRPTKQTKSTPPPPVPKMTIEELMKDKSTTKSPSLKSDVLGWANPFTGVPPIEPVQVIRDTRPYAARANVSLPERSSNRSQPQSRKSLGPEERSEREVASSPSQVTTEEIPDSERLALVEQHLRETRERSAQ